MAAASVEPSAALTAIESDDARWPEAWRIPDEIEDQKAENRLSENVPVSPALLKELGVLYWKMDPASFEYPVKEVPWEPAEGTVVDPKLAAIRDGRGYNYAEILTIHPDTLPNYDKMIAMFFEEHIHDAEEIRYILGGSGYFDVRDFEDSWIRIKLSAGDLITLPEGIYHRFTLDDRDMIKAMRLFKGTPVWTPFNRPQEEHPSRQAYVSEVVALAQTAKKRKTEDEAAGSI